jgi:hypothetical protein
MEENKQPTQTGVYSEYVGSLKDANEPKKKRKPGKNDWMKFMYPNRSVRRKFDIKGSEKYKLTREEVVNGKTLLDKIGEVLRGNHEHGAMLHRSFENEVATDHMHYERAKDEACLKSLTEALGPERGVKAHNNNRRISGVYEEKKTGR